MDAQGSFVLFLGVFYDGVAGLGVFFEGDLGGVGGAFDLAGLAHEFAMLAVNFDRLVFEGIRFPFATLHNHTIPRAVVRLTILPLPENQTLFLLRDQFSSRIILAASGSS